MRIGSWMSITVALGVAAGGCADSGMEQQPDPFGVAGAPIGTSGIGAGGAGGMMPVTQPTGGVTGSAGTMGTAGVTGAAGVTGTAGTMATAGTTGAAGTMGEAGMTGTAGTMATAGTGGMPTFGDDEPRIPPMPASCPEFRSGTSTITVKGQNVDLWVGPAGMKGPLVFYWHGTGSRSSEAVGGLGPGVNEVMSQGGVIASFTTTTSSGTNTGNNVWYTGDFEMADEIFACAHAAGLVDPRRVYTGGCSAGGLQASAMVYGRSSYLAAAMPNSGGTFRSYPQDNPERLAAVMAAHGAMGTDVVIIDFAQTTTTQCNDIAGKGGFMVQCDHGGRHCGSPPDLKAAQWQFLKDHPFGVEPLPYANGLPSSVPSYCKICQ